MEFFVVEEHSRARSRTLSYTDSKINVTGQKEFGMCMQGGMNVGCTMVVYSIGGHDLGSPETIT